MEWDVVQPSLIMLQTICYIGGKYTILCQFFFKKETELELWLSGRVLARHTRGPEFHPHIYSVNICSYTYLFLKWCLCVYILQENLDDHVVNCSLNYGQVALGVSPPFI